MFKIYQVHSYGGEYEDKYDYIEKSFLLKAKAEEYVDQLIKEHNELTEQQQACYDCVNHDKKGKEMFEKRDSCPNADLVGHDNYYLCEGDLRYDWCTEWENYYVEEVEVEE